MASGCPATLPVETEPNDFNMLRCNNRLQWIDTVRIFIYGNDWSFDVDSTPHTL